MKRGPKIRPNYQPETPHIERVTNPKCPLKLTAPERQEWRKLVALIGPMGILTQADELALVLLVRAQVRLDKCEHVMAREGLTVENHGQKVQHPCMKIRDRAAAEVARLLRCFSLFPSARKALPTVPLPELDPDDPLLLLD